MKTVVASIKSPSDYATLSAECARLLAAGLPVALPTETVYGLAADAFNPAAVRRLFAIKGRPSHNPIIVHVSDIQMARECVQGWSPAADALARKFWPGPLTLVLPRSDKIPDEITAGGTTVGVRCPSHPFTLEVIKALGRPIAAPSANLSGELSPTTADHVQHSLDGKIPLIVDAGPCPVGIESTVIDLAGGPRLVLRPGMIAERSIREALGEVEGVGVGVGEGKGKDRAEARKGGREEERVLRSPGLLERHYAPKSRLVVWSWPEEEGLLLQIERAGLSPGECHVISYSNVPLRAGFGRVAVVPFDPEAYARALYAVLHESDALLPRLIIVEAVPDSPEWQGIADRLSRAAAV